MLSPIDRRKFIALAAGVSSATGIGRLYAQNGQSEPPLPNPEIFQSGDMVWPKKPGVFVPYKSELVAGSVQDEEQKWLREKREFIARARQGGTYFSSEQLDALERMPFREFYARYAGDQRPGIPGAYSSGSGVYVGHVGIILVDSERVSWVIEALLDKGVVKSRYTDWIKSRPGEIVWLGRVRNLDTEQRTLIATESEKYINGPYNFWNFDLDDPSGFYCSKLVWLSIWRRLHFAIDGDSNPKRIFWFSPKQLLYSKAIVRLHDPGPYAFE
jgi:hypothetical protein